MESNPLYFAHLEEVNKNKPMKKGLMVLCLTILVGLVSCSGDSEELAPVVPNPDPYPVAELLYLPVVVHVLHNGEPIGEGPNLSTQRITRQIEILNEDFRRKHGTRGFNDHPDGGDARIEFRLARQNPEGQSSTGIVRIDTSSVKKPNLGYNLNHFAQYSYWNPNQYINIWTTPLPDAAKCVVLGEASGPDTDLPGTELLSLPGPGDAEGILVNWNHFGESEIDCHARWGRTLTHEMGHYLGLLHTWGGKDCAFNDYCDDTPAVDKTVFGREAFAGCTGETIMIGNYMNYSDDDIMNIFTQDQIARMRYVLDRHPGRKALLTSPGLGAP